MLRSAELEVAIVFEYRDLSQPEFDRLYEGIELRHLIDDPMYIAVPRDHPAARKPRVRLEDFADDVWIQNDTRGPCGRLHPGGLRGRGLRAEYRLRVGRLQRGPGPDRRGRGGLAAAGLSLTNVREDIAVRSLGHRAPGPPDRVRRAGGPLPLTGHGGDARHPHRGGRGFELPSGMRPWRSWPRRTCPDLVLCVQSQDTRGLAEPLGWVRRIEA